MVLLIDSKDSNAYWRKLKQRLKEEGNETVTNCHGLKMIAKDGKSRMTYIVTSQNNKMINKKVIINAQR